MQRKGTRKRDLPHPGRGEIPDGRQPQGHLYRLFYFSERRPPGAEPTSPAGPHWHGQKFVRGDIALKTCNWRTKSRRP
jgi:hypothetical protein